MPGLKLRSDMTGALILPIHAGAVHQLPGLPFPVGQARPRQPYNFHERRALIPAGGEDCALSFTTVQDFAKVVALAVEYEVEWPVDGGITGGRLTVEELIAMGEKIRGT